MSDDIDDAAGADLVPCLRVHHIQQLPHVRATLEGALIPYLIKGEGVQHLFGAGTLGTGHDVATGAPLVLVPKARLDEALQVLSEFEEADLGDAAPVAGRIDASTCPSCGGSLEAARGGDDALTCCYHCGADLAPA